MSDFWLQTSQHYKIMEVPFANDDKLIGRARSIKKRLLIKNLRRIFHIKKNPPTLRMVIYDLLMFMEIYYITAGM